jgi:hypothetical protein
VNYEPLPPSDGECGRKNDHPEGSSGVRKIIQTMGTRSQGLLQLRPVTFRYKQDEQGERQYRLIAEKVGKSVQS